MAYYLQFDGVNDYVNASGITVSSSFSFEFYGKITSSTDVNHDMFGLTFNQTERLSVGRNGNQWKILSAGKTPGQGGTYKENVLLKLRLDWNGSEFSLYEDDVFIYSVTPTTDTWVSSLNELVIGVDPNDVTLDPTGLDLYGFKLWVNSVLIHNYDPSATGGTGSILEDTVSGNDGVLQNFPTDNSQWVFYSAGGTITVTSTLGTISYASNATTVGITGSVNVTAALGTISYTSNDTSVSVTGSVDVTSTLGSISYASSAAVVGVTGSVDAIATLGTINYTSINPVVSIGGTVVVQSTLGTISYTSNVVDIGLQGVVSIPATLGAISYASNNASVSLAGLIDVNATIGTISYTNNNATVTVAAGQAFGVVGVGFADDLYGSTFKPNSITVTFRG